MLVNYIITHACTLTLTLTHTHTHTHRWEESIQKAMLGLSDNSTSPDIPASPQGDDFSIGLDVMTMHLNPRGQSLPDLIRPYVLMTTVTNFGHN